MEGRQVDIREGSQRGSWGGSGYQTMSRREEKMPARNDESSKSDDGWRTVGKQAGKTHRQTESSGYGSQDKKVDTQSPDYSTRSNQADQKVSTRSVHCPSEISHGKDRFNQMGRILAKREKLFRIPIRHGIKHRQRGKELLLPVVCQERL